VLGINLNYEFLKNISVRKFSAIVSLVISLVFLLIYLVLTGLNIISGPAVNVFLFVWLIFGTSYFVLKLFINTFISRKLKLLYKLISDSKLGEEIKKDSNFTDASMFTQIEQDIEAWIVRKNYELDQQKHLEKYRKEYIGNVSHELKTPVFNIQGYLQTLLDGGLEDSSINKVFLKKALKNTQRLQSIIDDLNIVYKLESGQESLELSHINIRELIEEVFEENASLATSRNIKLKFKKGTDQDYIVEADKEYLHIVLTNLINNSIKYGKEGGFTKLSLYDIEPEILIEVSDNGIGIPDEHLKHVFDRFYRVDKSRSREQGGSGLGLSIVKHIVESHGQKLHVRSKEGFGTTFGFTLKRIK